MHSFSLSIILFGIAVLVNGDAVSDALSATPTASINNGKIVGTTTSIAGPSGSSIAVNKFLGIPFAAAPTGTARFTPPKAPANWGTLSTTEYKSSCIQVFAGTAALQAFTKEVFNDPFSAKKPNESEDCLYLNVFAPKKAWNVKKPSYPVLVWIFGGARKFGSATLSMYDGSHFAALEDVIVVTVAYRTNVFGAPLTSSVNVTDRNLALLDQRAGLQWVQDNIAQFGGDNKSVTVFGESAGAVAVDILITSYPSDSTPPFRAAIMESGTYAYGFATCSNETPLSWDKLVNATGCHMPTANASFACMQSADAGKIKSAMENDASIEFFWACDNKNIVPDPRHRLEGGNFAKVPILLGSNAQDGSFYVSPAFWSDALLPYYLTYQLNIPFNSSLYNTILNAYPIGSGGRYDARTQAIEIATDWNFHCPTVLHAATSAPSIPTWRYIFNGTFKNTRFTDPTNWPVQYQLAYHTSEIPFVFNTYPSTTNTTEGNEEKKLGDAMRQAWANFAKNPTNPPLQNWPKSGSDGADVMVFGGPGSGSAQPSKETGRCLDIWKPFITAYTS